MVCSDYGFAWTPHGTYARDLQHFVELLDFTPMESIIAATAGVAKLFMREDLGKIKPGYFADCILVDGDPLKNIKVLQDHDKLNVICLNGKIHKAAPSEFFQTETPLTNGVPSKDHYNLAAYRDDLGRERIGSLDPESSMITPLALPSGTAVSNLYEVIEVGDESLVPAGEAFSLDSVKLLPPISGRDVLCVGKNYSEHAKEVNSSGFDATDKVDQPSHPVIFTKRYTSIIADGEEILPQQDFTDSLDYEGEIGVIIGRSGYRIQEEDAIDYVWGYTIINDVTARDKQRAHKQNYIGKSGDTYCPMGPIAVPARRLPKTLEVTTHINGQQRQKGTTEDLIFSIPNLIKILSEGQTLQAGDVLATGTPAGVGFGQKPPTFLKSGDLVEITVPGLGKLSNRIASPSTKNPTLSSTATISHLPTHNLGITNGGIGLTTLNSKRLLIKTLGPDGPQTHNRNSAEAPSSSSTPIVFIHGLGGNTCFFSPLISTLNLPTTHTCHLMDLEGHGLSPTHASSVLSISSYASDLAALFADSRYNLKSAILIAHSMGCLVAQTFASQHPSLVSKLILLGPPPSPLPAAAAEGCRKRADAVRAGGMIAVAPAVAMAGTAQKTQKERPLARGFVLAQLMSQIPEGYAKGCTALAGASENEIDVGRLGMKTLAVTGEEDKVAPPDRVRELAGRMKDCRVEVLKDVGHWHGVEDVEGVARVVRKFLEE